MSFKDHFSGHASLYETHRPSYPDALFDWLARQTPSHDLAWDCATGNGQAALGLAAHYRQVVASDASESQIAQARFHERVRYFRASAEKTSLDDQSVDLVTAAQAAHWFDLPGFFKEARRVLRPEGVIAIWCYNLHSINSEIDPILYRYYEEIVGPYWPPERRIVEDRYQSIEFPFQEFEPARFEMSRSLNLEQSIGYLQTWSSSQRFLKSQGSDPIDLIRQDLEQAWGDPTEERLIHWPLSLRIGRV